MNFCRLKAAYPGTCVGVSGYIDITVLLHGQTFKLFSVCSCHLQQKVVLQDSIFSGEFFPLFNP